MKIIILFIGNILFNASANVLMKLGTENLKDVNFSSFKSVFIKFVLNAPLIIGCTFYAISLLFYIFILQKTDLSLAYPIVVSCSMVSVMLLSNIMFRENITYNQIIGSTIILIGIYITLYKN